MIEILVFMFWQKTMQKGQNKKRPFLFLPHVICWFTISKSRKSQGQKKAKKAVKVMIALLHLVSKSCTFWHKSYTPKKSYIYFFLWAKHCINKGCGIEWTRVLKKKIKIVHKRMHFKYVLLYPFSDSLCPPVSQPFLGE